MSLYTNKTTPDYDKQRRATTTSTVNLASRHYTGDTHTLDNSCEVPEPDPSKMVRNCGREVRRSAHSKVEGRVPPRLSSANCTQLGTRDFQKADIQGNDRVRWTQRERNRQVQRTRMVVPRSPSPTPTAGMTFSRDDETPSHSNNGHISRPLSQTLQDRSLQNGAADDGSLDTDNGPVQSHVLNHGQNAEVGHTNEDSGDDSIEDDFADLFGPEPHLLCPPVQHDDTYQSTYGLQQHANRPVRPATSFKPIRMLSSRSPQDSDIDELTVDSLPTPQAKTSEKKKHPVNPYRGNDSIKKRVQNKRLQRILLDQPMPKPRKHPDRMVLKCTGKQEFR